MPSTSKKQHNLMAMVANDPKAAKRLGIPQSVGQDFVQADKGRKFGSGTRPDLAEINKPKTDHGKMNLFKGGGMAKKEHAEKGEMKADIKQDKAIVKKAVGMHDKQLHGGKKTNLSALKSGGRIAAKGTHPVQKQAKRGAIEVKMCGGGYMKKGK